MHHIRRIMLPFTSIVGQDNMKYALILNAINPRIGGVLIRGEKGTAKSTAVRALADLLEDISAVEGCPFNCNPVDVKEMCDLCYELNQKGGLRSTKRRTPVVNLPLGATEDRVVGSLDVERAIKEGIKALEPGILAAANRGILYIDEVNLLDDHVADVLLDSAAMGVNIVEREGVSVAHPARFILVGTMNPEEGEIRPQLLDRFGLQVSVEVIEDADQRVEIIKRAEWHEADPEGFAAKYAHEQDDLRRRISNAKRLLPGVKLGDPLLKAIAVSCCEMGVKTHRAEIVIARTARTIAAFEGRSEVNYDDVRRAMMLALPHRMRSRPFEPPTLNKERLDKTLSQHKPPEEHKEAGGPRENDGRKGKHEKDHGESENDGKCDDIAPDRGIDGDPGPVQSHAEEKVFDPGEPIDARMIRIPRRMDRIARRSGGRRMRSLSMKSAGRYLRHRLPKGGKDFALDATIRAAAPYQRMRSGPNTVNVKAQDLREKERVRRISACVLFAVDASGSMGAARRMESAKGAVLSMLMDSYQKRDRVGMIAFRGSEAELLLPPGRSVDLAMSRLKEMPTGGRTPLSAGLSRALAVLKGELFKDRETKPMLVLVSDGRANVAMSGDIRQEIKEISRQFRDSGVHTIVIDTETMGSTSMEMHLGFCSEIAAEAAGSYYPISSLSADSLFGIVNEEAQMMFDGLI